MKFNFLKKLTVAFLLSIGTFMTLPAYAWPDVDHMNMCGAPAKVVRSYGGNMQGWQAHDRYIAARGNNYYFRTMCPETKASKMKKAAYKKPSAKAKKNMSSDMLSAKRALEKMTKKKKSTYNEKLDCARVDRLNNLGLVLKRKR